MALMTLRQLLLLLWLIWNIAVAATYAWDKYRAVRGEWRVPERHLLLMALCLGGGGAYLAARLCHHKTRKWYFHLAWWLGLLLSAGLIYLLLTTLN